MLNKWFNEILKFQAYSSIYWKSKQKNLKWVEDETTRQFRIRVDNVPPIHMT